MTEGTLQSLSPIISQFLPTIVLKLASDLPHFNRDVVAQDLLPSKQ
jgi:hypothetical protein